MKPAMYFIMALLASTVLFFSGCGKNEKTETDNKQGSAESKTRLTFMYFGTSLEKKAVAELTSNFSRKFPNIEVDAQCVPNESYNAKIATLVASGNTPDIAYVNEEQLFPWADAGKIKFLSDLYSNDKTFNTNELLDIGKFYIGDKLLATSTAMEVVILYYNKDLFKKEGLDLPPVEADKAWNWDQLVKNAQKLTIDRNGKHADEPGFDPKNIRQYGLSITTNWLYFWPFILSNGADIATPDGKDTMIDKPEFYETVQKIADLINKYHVAPNPAQKKSMPTIDVCLMSGQVAMAVSGQWSLLDMSKAKVNFGIGVMPKIKKPLTIAVGAPTVIFNSTKAPADAWELYKYHNSVEMSPMLFCNGLWMPMEKKYYTSPEYIKVWTDNSAHPKEYKTAVIDYMLNNARPSPSYSLKNWDKISEMLTTSLDNVWLGNETAEHAMKELAPKIRPLFQGRYSMKNVSFYNP